MKTLSKRQANTAVSLSARISRSIPIFISIPLFIVLYVTHAYAGQVTLGWDSNNEPDLAGYKIYYGNSSGDYTQSKDVNDRTATSCIITNLTEGQTYYFAATAYNTELIESDYSAEISCTISSITTSIPTTTTTIPPTTSSSTSSIIPTTTTTILPTTSSSTTSIIPTTTTTTASGGRSGGGGGGGGGGGTPASSTTTTTQSITTTTALKISTTTVPAEATTTIKINTSPVANAGYDRSVQIGDTVLLDGHSSYDNDRDVLQYHWEQISGLKVIIENENEVIASFVAENKGVYEFELTVSDGILQNSDSVYIEITEKTIQLIYPSNDEVFSSRPTLRWNGNGCGSFKVYMSRDGKQFYEVGTTTEENFTVRPLANLLFSTNKKNFSPIYWKVLGKHDGEENIWVESPTWQYYNIRKNVLIDNFFAWLSSIINNASK